MPDRQRIWVFDVDGTLTPHRQAMTPKFADKFSRWAEDNVFYLCTGSDAEKIEEQVDRSILDAAAGIFTCMGNVFTVNGKEIYRREFDPPEGLEKWLKKALKTSPYSVRTGNHLERRVGMWNFSIVGRNATLEQRNGYHKYDSMFREREWIASIINVDFAGKVVASVGGQISIDICQPGADKSQIMNELLARHADISVHFVGDAIRPDGNDWGLAERIREIGQPHEFTLTKNPNHTLRIIGAAL